MTEYRPFSSHNALPHLTIHSFRLCQLYRHSQDYALYNVPRTISIAHQGRSKKTSLAKDDRSSLSNGLYVGHISYVMDALPFPVSFYPLEQPPDAHGLSLGSMPISLIHIYLNIP